MWVSFLSPERPSPRESWLFRTLFLFLAFFFFFFFFFRDVGTGCMMTTEVGFDSAECALDE
jgi:hypothetical protein